MLTNTITPDEDEPSPAGRPNAAPGFLSAITGFFKPKADASLRETIEEYIDESAENGGADDLASIHERVLLSNILELRDLTVDSIMLPRADIQAIEVTADKKEIFALFADIQVSRIPVYEGTLDNVLGTIHLKDIIGALAEERNIKLKDMVTDVPVISPSMPLLDLLLTMRQSRRHMALVVDEYGGVDGLVTIGDIIEALVGELDDEHENDDRDPQMMDTASGAVLADARVELEDFAVRYGLTFSEEEYEENDTLGGLVFDIAGRVPARGEVISHVSGLSFEILDANPRQINRLRIRNIPKSDDLQLAKNA